LVGSLNYVSDKIDDFSETYLGEVKKFSGKFDEQDLINTLATQSAA